jgi:hypothetical protein
VIDNIFQLCSNVAVFSQTYVTDYFYFEGEILLGNMAEKDKEEKAIDCTNCIHKNKSKLSEKKIVESLKHLEGIKNTLLSIIK